MRRNLLLLGGLAVLLLVGSVAAPSGEERPVALGTAAPATSTATLLQDLVSGDPARTASGVEALGSRDDPGWSAVGIELLRAQQVGVVEGLDRRALVAAMERVSGRDFGDDWPDWVRWYAGSDLHAPVGFTGWKGRLLARIDPRFGPLLAEGIPSRIRTEEIIWGGVPFEGIPALDRPKLVPAAKADYLEEGEPVFGVSIAGEARAYPLRILDWHEMVNDVVGGVPISLAYCTLCGSGIVYDGRAPDGTTYDFGSSGFLMRSNKLMVDRQTRSLWNQLTGEPVVGPLVDEEPFRLRVLPSVVTRFGDWKRRHPKTLVLSLETGHQRPYEPGAAYGDYFADEELMFPVRRPEGPLAPKTRVFGIERAGIAKAWVLDALVEQRVVNDSLAGQGLVLVANEGAIEVEGRSRRSGRTRRYQAGASVRAFTRPEGVELTTDPAGGLRDGRGRRFEQTEDALLGPEGERFARVPGILSYGFAWASYHPRTLIYPSPAGTPYPGR